jgi:hypothetical protein
MLQPNKLVQALMLLICVLETTSSNIGRNTDSIEIFCGVCLSVPPRESWEVPQITPQPRQSKSFQINYPK